MEKKLIEQIVKESNTINEALVKLGKNTSSGAYKSFKKYVYENNIDISHFWGRKKIIEEQFKNGKIKKIESELMLIENATVSRGSLKKRIINEKLIKYECSLCGNDGNWRGVKISLILDHINGKNNDNRLENLRFVCPNCNSTLITHCRGHIAFELKKKKENKKKDWSDKRRKDRPNTRKVNRPTLDVLLKDVEEIGYSATGRKYGVSDNAIRKWIKRYSHK